jgi:RNA polymerase sigma factor (sigma-70 family)
LEASALTSASQHGLLARRSPLLKLQGDERLIAMARRGNAGAFETIVDRYQGRLLGFCRQMLGSTEDAEDVLQEVFVNAYRAMLADEREINLRPWLYRIARNRCLNHLRKPTADAQESMDMVPAVEAAGTAERAHNREEFRQLLCDVGKLPETQRSALLLREMDALSYEEIAQAMDTSVPSVKSLLVRARISLAEASQARQLTCGEVRLALAEAAEGLRKASGPVRRHVRDCEECAGFRSQVRADERALAAALAPVGTLMALKGFVLSKLGLGGASAGAAGAGAGAGATGAVGSVGGGAAAAVGGSGAAGGIGAVGGAIGTKAVAGVVTAAVLTAGAVEVKQSVAPVAASRGARVVRVRRRAPALAGARAARPAEPRHDAATAQASAAPPPPQPAPETQPQPATEQPPAAAAPEAVPASSGEASAHPSSGDDGTAGVTGASPSGSGGSGSQTVVVTVGGSSPPPAESSPPPAEATPPPEPAPPAESPPESPAESPPRAEEAPATP